MKIKLWKNVFYLNKIQTVFSKDDTAQDILSQMNIIIFFKLYIFPSLEK